MAEAFEIKVTGLKEVQKALYSFSQKLGDRIVIASLQQGANLVKRAAKNSAPRKSGRLRSAIVVRKSRIHSGRLSGDMIGVYLTIRTGKGKKDPKDGFYGRWQESGWNVRGQSRDESNTPSRVNRRGKRLFSRSAIRAAGFSGGRTTLPGKRDISGKYFMRDAFRKNKMAAVQMIIAAANRGVELLANKGIR